MTTAIDTTSSPAPALIGAAAGELAARARDFVVQVRGRGRGHGTGIVWRDGATALTNYHVVAGAEAGLEVVTLGGRAYPAKLIAGNPRLDLALLTIEGGDLSPAPVGDSARLRVGELVFALGDPWGQRGVITAGVVSGLGEIPTPRGEQAASYIRSDVRLAPGNSGGPLLSARGEVIGINAMIFGGDLSIAIPAHVAAAWLAHLPGRPVVLGLGVQPAELPAALARPSQATGLLVAAVAAGGPAAGAGLLVGDLLIALDDEPLPRSEALIDALSRRAPGDAVRLELARGGQPLTLSVTLAEQRG
jgi:serine protease Do